MLCFFRGVNFIKVKEKIFKHKFRAWSDKQKYMAYEGTADLMTTQSFMHHFSDSLLMLWTGYKDKNDKDIFEGDLITSPNGQIKLAIVFFSQSSFWYKQWCDMYNEWTIQELGWLENYGTEKVGILHWSCNRISVEVVGNIFENPELLEGVSQHSI